MNFEPGQLLFETCYGPNWERISSVEREAWREKEQKYDARRAFLLGEKIEARSKFHPIDDWVDVEYPAWQNKNVEFRKKLLEKHKLKHT